MEDKIMKVFLKKIASVSIFILLLAAPITILCDEQTIQSSEKKEQTKTTLEKIKSVAWSIIKNSAIAYAMPMAGTLFHELGHAIVGKVLLDSPIDITLGQNPENH